MTESETLHRTLNRTLNRPTYSDTLTRLTHRAKLAGNNVGFSVDASSDGQEAEAD